MKIKQVFKLYLTMLVGLLCSAVVMFMLATMMQLLLVSGYVNADFANAIWLIALALVLPLVLSACVVAHTSRESAHD
jgi:chromate transport protein ChrA